ncbi:NUDIX hydrolase [Bacillus sp. APMAM]|nr:NUDIX hydrolase [Bacillus sp. APMAM]RTZ56813.1 NUDIX domain-containing protein [Bacillus sp. SAJ1]
MQKVRKYHRAFSVYGICYENGKLLVINKNGGPYKNRYDLPGGSLEVAESLTAAMKREFLEETGFEIEIKQNIGVIDFMLPWDWKEYTDVHHIAVFYSVKIIGGELTKPSPFDGQDSLEALWISEPDVSIDNSSPLVLKAFEWIRESNLGLHVEVYEKWEVKSKK